MDLIDREQIEYPKTDNPKGKYWDRLVTESYINSLPTIQAIPLDKVKQARERIQKLADMCGEDDLNDIKARGNFGLALQIIDEVVFEIEGE